MISRSPVIEGSVETVRRSSLTNGASGSGARRYRIALAVTPSCAVSSDPRRRRHQDQHVPAHHGSGGAAQGQHRRRDRDGRQLCRVAKLRYPFDVLPRRRHQQHLRSAVADGGARRVIEHQVF
jgi:hypothetical protein